MSTAGAVGRLRWRCRRGMRELDQLLGGWLDRHAEATTAELAAFERLLDESDVELYAWLTGREPSPPRHGALLDEIRAAAGVAPA